MSLKIIGEINNFKKAIDKALKDSHNEQVLDILRAIALLQLSKDTIKDTRIGYTVNDVKKKYMSDTDALSNEIVELAKNLLIQWKRTLNPESSSAPAKAAAAPPADGNIELENISESRKKIARLLAKELAVSASAASSGYQPERKAIEIERAIDDAFPSQLQSKEYSNKVRSLMFNIKRNEMLRIDILSNSISPSKLVHMTSDELASQEVLAKRLKEQREEDESRRLDWADEHKAEIQRELGIDPDNDWDFEEIVVSDNDD